MPREVQRESAKNGYQFMLAVTFYIFLHVT